MSKQTKYKDLDEVKMEIRRTEVKRARAEQCLLAHKQEADAYFKLCNELNPKGGNPDGLTEGQRALFHKSDRLGKEARKDQATHLRAMQRAEVKLERLKSLLAVASTPTFPFMQGDQSVVG